MIDLVFLLEVLKDAEHELGEPEIAELVSIALDRKVAQAINILETHLGINE